MEISERPVRILIVEDESLLASRLAEFLAEKGFSTRFVSEGAAALKLMGEWQPEFVFYKLGISDLSGYDFLKKMKALDKLGETKTNVIIFADSNDPAAVRECAKLGAIDYVTKPYRHSELLQRVLLHMQAKREVPDLGTDGAQAHDHASSRYAMHVMDAALREALKAGPAVERLHMLTVHAAKIMKAVRVSIVRCELSQPQGAVIVSNDKRDVGQLHIDIDKYPEIFYVLSKDKLIAVDHLGKADRRLQLSAGLAKTIHFNSMIIAPVRVFEQPWGVLSVRMSPPPVQRLTDFEIYFVQQIANVAALVIARDPQLLSRAPGSSAEDDSGAQSA
jgi:DNA-binding response OmpR family regulator